MRFPKCRVIKALLARLLFLTHSLVAVGHTANVLGDSTWWLLALTNVGLFCETVYTIVKRNGREWRWICPSAVWYLLSTVPAIYLLELDQLRRRSGTVHNVSSHTQGNTSGDVPQVPVSPIEIAEEWLPIRLTPDLWVEVIEQMLLLFLIIARWLMPKGNISRDELSQLLFVYIAIASDIMEVFELFEEERVYRSVILRYIILGVWGISLLQFTLVLTASRNPKKARPVGASADTPMNSSTSGHVCCRVPYVEILSLLTSFFIMDGPFLAIRLYVMIALEVRTYNIIFFTGKNILMVSLLLYRFIVLMNDIRKRKSIYDDEISIGTFKNSGVFPDGQNPPDDSEIHPKVTEDKFNSGFDQLPGKLKEGTQPESLDNHCSAIARDSSDHVIYDMESKERPPPFRISEGEQKIVQNPIENNTTFQTKDHALRESSSIPECDRKTDSDQENSSQGEFSSGSQTRESSVSQNGSFPTNSDLNDDTSNQTNSL